MYVFLTSVGFIWLFIVFLDTIFKTCMFHPYYRGLHAIGVEVRPLLIYWRITRFNRFLNRMGHWKPQFIKSWFNVGAFITIIIAFPCLILYGVALLEIFKSSTPEEFQSSKLTPVLPGVNFPLSQWKLYACVIFICSVFHEFGHALAASRQGISIESCGFAVCFIAPIAFVQLKSEFKMISKWQQMCIWCAGIWHNIVLSLLALLLLKNFLLIVSPLFYVGSGISVLEIHKQSGLNNPGGFAIGDHMYGIGNCSVADTDTWVKCLDELNDKSHRLCIPEDRLHKVYSSPFIVKECPYEAGSLYFTPEQWWYKTGVCLNARTAVQRYSLCKKTSHCEESSLCMTPQLPESHKFLIIYRHEKPVVLYIGSIHELKMDVKWSDFLSRVKYLSPAIAESFREFLVYVLMFSSGLACLNVLPIFSLDGKFIMENFIHMFLAKYFSFQRRIYIVKSINVFSLGVVGLLAVITVHKVLKFYF